MLVIVLGLMVSLARYVRKESAEQLTRDVLRQFDDIAREYLKNNPKGLDSVPLFVPAGVDEPTEAILADTAEKNNEAFVRILKAEFLRSEQGKTNGGANGDKSSKSDDAFSLPRSDRFGNVPLSLYNEAGFRDAWGKPIIYMPQMHRSIGMAPVDRPDPTEKDHSPPTFFFFSAGADGHYLTRDDNLYSYEATPGRASAK